MKNLSIKKIKQSIQDRKNTHLTLTENVKTYHSLLNIEEIAFCNGALSKKIKELMALSISIVTKCEPCMEWHLDKSLEAGATDDEVYEAIDVAIEMGGGQAAAYSRFALIALEYYRNHQEG